MKTGSPTLLEIAERTKICPRYLKAIEAGRFHELPGGIYSASYIRQYAAALGGSPETLLEHYRLRCGEKTPPPDGTNLIARFQAMLASLMVTVRRRRWQ